MKWFVVGCAGACVLIVGANYAAATPWALPYAFGALLIVGVNDGIFRHRAGHPARRPRRALIERGNR